MTRQELATRQAGFLDAVAHEDGQYDDISDDQLESKRETLFNKRCGHAMRAAPALAAFLGARFRPIFRAYFTCIGSLFRWFNRRSHKRIPQLGTSFETDRQSAGSDRVRECASIGRCWLWCFRSERLKRSDARPEIQSS